MKSKRYISFLGSLLLLVVSILFFGCNVQADQNESNVGVKIEPKNLYIKSVLAPKFGTHEVQKKEQTIASESDLVITVVDDRSANIKSPWSLYYQIGTFKNNQGAKIEPITSIMKGTLSDASEKEPIKDYDAIESDSFTNNKKTNIVRNSNTAYNVYKYRINRGNIKLVIPPNQLRGVYKTQQTITLTSVPTVK